MLKKEVNQQKIFHFENQFKVQQQLGMDQILYIVDHLPTYYLLTY